MTREEASSILKNILADLQRGAKDTDNISCCSEYGFITYGKAKDCIKALEQEPVLDKIRAEIKSLERFEIRGEVTPLVNVDKVLEIIDKAESEDKE